MIKLSDFFKDNKKIVVKTTLDGLLSGVILSKYLGCEIVGYSNGGEIWLSKEIMDLCKPIYVGQYISDYMVRSVDSHMIVFDQQHLKKLRQNDNIINPNVQWGAYFKDYFYMYPFGLSLYLIALLEKEGYDISIPGINQKFESIDITIDGWYLLLSAANSLRNSRNTQYESNIIQWTLYIKSLSQFGKNTEWLINQINLYRIGEIVHQPISAFLETFDFTEYNGTLLLGNISNPVNRSGNIEENLKRFLSLSFKFFDLEENFIRDNLFYHSIEYIPAGWDGQSSLKDFLDFINREQIFSYSFNRWPKSSNNFSCYSIKYENDYTILNKETKEFINCYIEERKKGYWGKSKDLNFLFKKCLSSIWPEEGYSLDFLGIKNPKPLLDNKYYDEYIKYYKLYFYKSDIVSPNGSYKYISIPHPKLIFSIQKNVYPVSFEIMIPKKCSSIKRFFGLQKYVSYECSFPYEDGMKIDDYIERDIADYIVPEIWEKIYIRHYSLAVWDAFLLNEARYILPVCYDYERKNIICDLEDLYIMINRYSEHYPFLPNIINTNLNSYYFLPKIHLGIHWEGLEMHRVPIHYAIITYHYWQQNKGFIKCEQFLEWIDDFHVKFTEKHEEIIIDTSI